MNIIGNKVIIRAMEIDDMKHYLSMINDPETEYMVAGWSFPLSLYQQNKWFEKVCDDKKNLRFTIIEKNTSDVLGMANLVDIDWKNRTAFHGIKLLPNAPKGKGYATDAVMAIMKYAFCELQLNRLDGSIIEYNEASMKLYTKCGWQIEGNRRKSVFKNNKYHDNILVGILKEEYLNIIEHIGK